MTKSQVLILILASFILMQTTSAQECSRLMNFGDSNTKKAPPFKVEVSNPGKLLKEVFLRQELLAKKISEGFRRKDSHSFELDLNHQVTEAIQELGRDYLAHLRETIRTTTAFLEHLNIHNKGVSTKFDFANAIASIRKFEKSLDSESQYFQPKPVLSTPTAKKEISAVVRIIALQIRWSSVASKNNPIVEIISEIKNQSPELLESKRTQYLFQSLLISQIQEAIFQATSTSVIRSEEPYVTGHKALWLFKDYVQGHLNFWINFNVGADAGSLRPQLPLPGNSFLSAFLFSEIVKNANESTRRRIGEITASKLAKVEAFEYSTYTEVRVSDFGDPTTYSAHAYVGESTKGPLRNGFGVGRFYIYMLAEILGFSLEFQPKSDGSGGMMRVYMPKPKTDTP